MRILMVTPYPPTRDGIAAYAVQSVRALRSGGHQVEVLSPGPSAAHHHLDLVGPRGALALARRVRDYTRVIVQFHPDFFYPRDVSARRRLQESLALAVAFRRAHEVEVVVHEIDGRHGRRRTPDGFAARKLWRSVDRIVVHTDRERRDFARDFGVPLRRIQVADHGADFVPRTHHDRASARASLGVPPDAFVFLAIGFIQPHKGFDRAVRAYAGLRLPDTRLDIVGSVRVEEPEYVAYGEELAALVAATPGAHLHRGFVSDELFDRWIVAADVVVLPYRSIWSSGVLGRARLFSRPVIATSVGGLPDQAAALGETGHVNQPGQTGHVNQPGQTGHVNQRGQTGQVGQTGPELSVRLVEDDDELRVAMWVAAGGDPGAGPHGTPGPDGVAAPGAGLTTTLDGAGGPSLVTAAVAAAPWPVDGADLRAAVQREVIDRAAAHRGRLSPANRPESTGDAGPDGSRWGAAAAAAKNAVGGAAALAELASAPIRRIGHVDLPAATSNRLAARLAKRLVRRLTAWELEPVVAQLNALRAAVVDALEASVATPGDRPPAESPVPPERTHPTARPSPTAPTAQPGSPGSPGSIAPANTASSIAQCGAATSSTSAIASTSATSVNSDTPDGSPMDAAGVREIEVGTSGAEPGGGSGASDPTTVVEPSHTTSTRSLPDTPASPVRPDPPAGDDRPPAGEVRPPAAPTSPGRDGGQPS